MVQSTAALPVASYAELVETLPSLKPFIASLSARLTSVAPPPAIFIHAPTNTSLVLPLVLQIIQGHLATLSLAAQPTVQDLLPKTAVLDLEELSTTRAAFDRALNTFSGWSTDGNPAAWNEAEGLVMNWDGRDEGVSVERVLKRSSRGGGGRPEKRARIDEEVDVVPESEEEEEDEGEGELGDEWTLNWRRDTLPPKDPVGPIRDTLDQFHLGLATILKFGKDPDGSSTGSALFPDPARRRWLVVNHAELLNEVASAGNVGGAPKETGLGMTFASTLYRLGQLSSLPVTTVSISNLGWSKAREGMVGLATPELLVFPPLTATALDTPALVALFHSLAKLVYETFGTTARNSLDELAYLCAKFWPKWLFCVETEISPISATDTARLSQQLKNDFRQELAEIAQPHQSLETLASTDAAPSLTGFTGHMPDAGPSGFPPVQAPEEDRRLASSSGQSLRQQTLSQNATSGVALASSLAASPTKAATSITDSSLTKSLPVLAKWLLVASFFAGANPPKSDVALFVGHDGEIAKKGAKARQGKGPKPGSSKNAKVRTDLTGGKAFPLERLLAIFEAILRLSDKCKYASQSTDVLMQVNTLISLRLLQRVSASDKLLDGVKLKCRLTRDTAYALGLSIGLTPSNMNDFMWVPNV
ncbi:hypothetical protein RQP46_004050 [Phenoliferia psychrophenolica]